VRVEDESSEFSTELFSDDIAFQDVTDEDIEAFLQEQEEGREGGFWNLPTIAGLAIIGVGVAYLLQQLGLWIPFDFTTLVGALPWFAGALIILLGFGVLGWKPKRKKKAKKKTKTRPVRVAEKEVVVEEFKLRSKKTKKKLAKSRTNKKLAGVCGGLGEYFGVDATLIRIGFVIATVFGGGVPAIPLYIVLALIMSNPDKTTKKPEERITVIREVR
jgi:phage shock protein C